MYEPADRIQNMYESFNGSLLRMESWPGGCSTEEASNHECLGRFFFFVFSYPRDFMQNLKAVDF